MTSRPPRRRLTLLSAILLGAAVVATVVGFVVLDDRQDGLGLWIAMIPVVLLVAVAGGGGLALARARTSWAGLVIAWVATLVLATVAIGLLGVDPWEPPPPV